MAKRNLAKRNWVARRKLVGHNWVAHRKLVGHKLVRRSWVRRIGQWVEYRLSVAHRKSVEHRKLVEHRKSVEHRKLGCSCTFYILFFINLRTFRYL